MKKLFNFAIAASVLILLAGCNKLLDVKNESSIYGDGFWESESSADSYLTGAYTSFREVCNSLEHFESRSDVFVAGREGGTSNQWAQNLTAQTGVAWGSWYTVIQHCNMILSRIDDLSFKQESHKNQIKAEVYTMRAYLFFCLTRLYGDVPLEIEVTQSADKPLPTRTPASEVIAQVLSDLDMAISLYPTDNWAEGKSRASKRAAYAVKADALLWRAKVLGGGTADLESAVTCADNASGGTSLEEEFANIYGTRNGKEVIWSIHYGYPEYSGSYTHFLTLRDIFVDKAVNKDEIPYAKSGARSQYAPSPAIIALFNAYKGDIRKSNAYVEAVDASGASLGVSQRKMPGTKTETNVIFDNDNVLYRHAEMILFKAEAYAALGQTGPAIEQLNQVRRRAGIGDYTGPTDKASVEKEILDERGREFWLENKRWPDLIRFHSEGIIDIYEMVPNLKARKDAGIIVPLYLPITSTEMYLNPNLKQTAGYE